MKTVANMITELEQALSVLKQMDPNALVANMNIDGGGYSDSVEIVDFQLSIDPIEDGVVGVGVTYTEFE